MTLSLKNSITTSSRRLNFLLENLTDGTLGEVYYKVDGEATRLILSYLDTFGKKIHDEFDDKYFPSLRTEFLAEGETHEYTIRKFEERLDEIREKSPQLAKEHEKLVRSVMLDIIADQYMDKAIMTVTFAMSAVNDQRETDEIPEYQELKKIQNVLKFQLSAEKGR